MSTPRGQHVQVILERVSTGGTRHQAQFERASTGPMSGAERMKKQPCSMLSISGDASQRTREGCLACSSAARSSRRADGC